MSANLCPYLDFDLNFLIRFLLKRLFSLRFVIIRLMEHKIQKYVKNNLLIV